MEKLTGWVFTSCAGESGYEIVEYEFYIYKKCIQDLYLKIPDDSGLAVSLHYSIQKF